jgi:hypothetical protein
VPLEEEVRKERSRDGGDREIEECSHAEEKLDWIDKIPWTDYKTLQIMWCRLF